ncbi:MAG: hypothetical protein AMXMBFR83_04910 [Phycisphaerae bacterium]
MSLAFHSRTVPIAALSCWFLAGSPIVLGLEGPFVAMTLEQARARAEQEQKVVFVDFYATWCGPCKLLDQTTWKDEKVVAWLKEKTIPLKLDAEVEMRAADAYRVTGYPTLVFLRPDGREIGRLEGYLSAAEFIRAGNEILAKKDNPDAGSGPPAGGRWVVPWQVYGTMIAVLVAAGVLIARGRQRNNVAG